MLQILKKIQSFVSHFVCARGLFAALALFIFSVAGFAAGTKFDFDGNGRADMSVYRPSTSKWWINNTPILFNGYPTVVGWSPVTHLPHHKLAPADYNGDGITDFATFDPVTGYWNLELSFGMWMAPYYTPYSKEFWSGDGTEIPQSSGFNADNHDDIAYFHPSSGNWYVWDVKNLTALPTIQWGTMGDKPVVGDYNGDRIADRAVFRPGTGMWYIRGDSGQVIAKAWGTATDIPVPADYDCDGKTDCAVWRPSNGFWYIWNSSTNTPTFKQWGQGGDIPVPADYDGNGKADIAVYRPCGSSCPWYVYPPPPTFPIPFGNWGQAGDIPVPSAYIH